MRRTWLALAGSAAVAIWAAIAFAYASNPPVSRTGAPAVGSIAVEGTCAGCHGGNSLDSGGSVTLLGLPLSYEGGVTYHLVVRVASTQTAANASRRWGFEITAVDSLTGAGAGTFAVVNSSQTSIGSGTGSYSTRRYPRQYSSGAQDGAASPVEWQVDWTAPAAGASSVIRFYFVGLAGNGSGSSGDYVYTGSAPTRDAATPARPTTWGEVKSKYNH